MPAHSSPQSDAPRDGLTPPAYPGRGSKALLIDESGASSETTFSHSVQSFVRVLAR